MKKRNVMSMTVLAAAVTALVGGSANATEPCGDFGECKVLVEINSSDGDIGFHFLMDGDNLRYASLFNPKHRKIFSYITRRELRQQFLTETFAESAEPLCFEPEEGSDEEGEDFVMLEEFLDRWTEGEYHFYGIGEGWEVSHGVSNLSFNLPAAPMLLAWEEKEDKEGDVEGEISWQAGVDLGECSDGMESLPMAPADVPVAAWEVVLEPDVEDGNILGSMKYVVRIPGDAEEFEIEVPDDYLEMLPNDTPAKIEVGAIGFDDNATFTEIGDICLNEDEGCEEED